MLPSDLGRPMSFVMARIGDSRVMQFWDPDHLLAEAMKADARPPQPEADCCDMSGTLWDLAALYPAGTDWAARLPVATFFNGPVVHVAEEIEKALRSAK